MAPTLVDLFHRTRGLFRRIQGTNHSPFPKLLTLSELELNGGRFTRSEGSDCVSRSLRNGRKASKTPARHRSCGGVVVGTRVSGCNISDRQRYRIHEMKSSRSSTFCHRRNRRSFWDRMKSSRSSTFCHRRNRRSFWNLYRFE